MFDPYHKWLGIRPEHQPPNHYRLLGLEQFESDPDVIQSAGERQIAHVRSYSFGPHADLSQKILNEIARAKACLLNPPEKAAYDATLQPPSAIRVKRREIVPPPVASPPIATSLRVATPQQLKPHRTGVRVISAPIARRSRTRNLSLVVSVACLTIIMAAIAFAFYYSPRDHQIVAEPPVESRSEPAKKSFEKADPPQQRDRFQPPRSLRKPVPPESGSPSAPVPSPSNPKLPAPSEEQKARARESITIDGELTPQEFLDAAAAAEHPWLCYVLYEMAIEAALKQDNPAALRIGLQAVDELQRRFQISGDLKQPLQDRLLHHENKLQHGGNPRESDTPFAELSPRKAPAPEPPTSAKSRFPTIDAPRIDLTRVQTELPLELATEEINHSELRIEGNDLGAATLWDRLPPDGIARVAKPVRLVLRKEHPKAAIEISLHGRESIYVRVKPIMEDYDGRLYPWTQERMKTLQAVLIRETKRCENRIPRLEQQIPLITAQLNATRKQIRHLYNQAQLDLQQGQLEAQLSATQKELSAQKARLPILQRQIAGFNELFELAESVHLQGHVEFRIFDYVDNRERTLVRATAPE